MNLVDEQRVSAWHVLTQDDVDALAENTGDRRYTRITPKRVGVVAARSVAHRLRQRALTPSRPTPEPRGTGRHRTSASSAPPGS
jgi:hypothetical protein